MEPEKITIKEKKRADKIEVFDGELLHPSLDIKGTVLVLGFRYRSKPNEEKDMYVVSLADGRKFIHQGDSFSTEDKTYHLEKRGRKLAKIEEKWSMAALQEFLEAEASLRTPLSPHLLLERLVTIAKRYIELEQEIDYYLLCAWILGTYFFPAFYAYPFLNIKAPKRSGKSQCLNLLTQLSFNAIKARPSLAALGDTVDALRGTYLIDQADSLGRKNGPEELLEILADSYKKSGGKRRVVVIGKDKARSIQEFEIYGPKVFASIKELPEDLRDRCLIIPLIRSQRNFPDPDDGNEDWRGIRGQIYSFLLTDHNVISNRYDIKKIEYRSNNEILGRSLELWLPFEVILEHVGLQEKIGEAKSRFLSRYDFSEYEVSELEEVVVRTIMAQLGNEEQVTLSPKDVAKLIEDDLEVSTDIFKIGSNPKNDTPKQRAADVGWAIKKFNLASEKLPRTKEGMRYVFRKDKVESVYKSYCKTDDDHTPPTPTESKQADTKNIPVQESDVGEKVAVEDIHPDHTPENPMPI